MNGNPKTNDILEKIWEFVGSCNVIRDFGKVSIIPDIKIQEIMKTYQQLLTDYILKNNGFIHIAFQMEIKRMVFKLRLVNRHNILRNMDLYNIDTKAKMRLSCILIDLTEYLKEAYPVKCPNRNNNPLGCKSHKYKNDF